MVLSRCRWSESGSSRSASVVAQFSFGAWLRTVSVELSGLLNALWAVNRPERNGSSPGQELSHHAGTKEGCCNAREDVPPGDQDLGGSERFRAARPIPNVGSMRL